MESNKINILLYIFCIGVGIFIILPIVVTIFISFSSSRYLEFPPPAYSLKWYSILLNDPEWLESIWLSLQVAVLVTIISVLMGTAAAFALVRSNLPMKDLLFSILLSPIVIPVIITGVGSYLFYANLNLIETKSSLVLAHTTLALPLIIIIVSSSLHGVDRNLELTAQTLGAKPLSAFLRITFPLISPGVYAGGLFAFITSFDEPIVAIFIAGTKVETLPKKMWDGIQYEIDPTVTAVSTIIIIMTTILITTAEVIRHRVKNKTAKTETRSKIPKDIY